MIFHKKRKAYVMISHHEFMTEKILLDMQEYFLLSKVSLVGFFFFFFVLDSCKKPLR